ncbi:hypothetical protein HPB52_019551 [Rhipicephalus sanguineus]|uniref:Glucose-methanol-choline oxidoreductase N-terminal domain-containing protein n=1 Tax=Rhipicephalus sanguineus TaxID=34632 RepID=A0A9D4PHP9_RHISA|nr:hypothetical protein HPB52_019551 [Rhipicephalus sanguineus]
MEAAVAANRIQAIILDLTNFTEKKTLVGGGSAGAVLANRLSEDITATVLLIEAGGIENEVSDIPLIAATMQMSPLDWSYRTEPQKTSCFGLEGRRSPWPRGKALGGSSVINYMIYIRGNPHDYDHWAENGCEGWSWKEVFPYFLKSEDNRDPAILQNGFAIPQGTIRRSARCSTGKAFIKPIRHRKNLHITLYSHATKIHFDEWNNARAVQFERFKVPHMVFARREIILSAGSIGSTQILLLSGIGPKHDLQKMGLRPVAQLCIYMMISVKEGEVAYAYDDVLLSNNASLLGYNLQDHIYPGGMNFLVRDPVSMVQTRVFNLKQILRYLTIGKGPLTLLGGVEGLAFINTKYANKSMDWPDIEIHYLSGSPVSDGGQTFRRTEGISDELWEKVYAPYVYADTMSVYPVLLRPKSRGFVKLRSRNPYDPPLLDPKYLSHPDDIMTLVDAMKFSMAVAETPAFQRYGVRMWDLPFPGCDHYKHLSDENLACMARSFTNTIYHPVGTAKMGPVWDPTTVVDPKLRVKGVQRLRVIDASIMPTIVSGNTNAPSIMIGEKGADIVKAAWAHHSNFHQQLHEAAKRKR